MSPTMPPVALATVPSVLAAESPRRRQSFGEAAAFRGRPQNDVDDAASHLLYSPRQGQIQRQTHRQARRSARLRSWLPAAGSPIVIGLLVASYVDIVLSGRADLLHGRLPWQP